MNWLFNITLSWMVIDLLVISTTWYAAKTLPHLWPTWWRQVIVDVVDSEIRL